MQGQSSPVKIEFILVPVCHRSSCPNRDLKGLALCKFDRKTLAYYSSSSLYVLVTGYYLSIILIDFL